MHIPALLRPQALGKTQSRRFPGWGAGRAIPSCGIPAACFLLRKRKKKKRDLLPCCGFGTERGMQQEGRSRDGPKPNHSGRQSPLGRARPGTLRPPQALGTGSSGDSSRSKGTRGRTRSRASGPTGLARRLRLRSDAMVASFSTGTSAKREHPGERPSWHRLQTPTPPPPPQAFIEPGTSSNSIKICDYSSVLARCKHRDIKGGHCPPVLPVLKKTLLGC